MADKVDVIVVGAGPAGSAAAFVLAKNGVEVALLERGAKPGAKNLFGGVLFTTVLSDLIPNFLEEAPLERHILKRKFSLLSQTSEMSFEFGSEAFNQPPYNHSFSVFRVPFDAWFAGKAEAAGAMVIPSTVVEDLVWNGDQVIGVKMHGGDELHAKVVVAADGVNSLLAEKAKLRKPFDSHSMIMAAKMVIGLPREVIEDRFGLEKEEGASIQYFGDAVKGLFGGGFLYTNKESLSVGMGCSVHAMGYSKNKPEEILNHMVEHPCIRKWLRGGEILEYSGHMIPEYGYDRMPKLYGNGILVTGDAAGFVDASHYQEGTNLAMYSGVAAAETILVARAKEDFSERTLKEYRTKLENSFVLKDLKKFRRLPEFGKNGARFFKEYPELFAELMQDYFSMSLKPKAEIEKEVFKKFMKKGKPLRFAKDMFNLIRSVR